MAMHGSCLRRLRVWKGYSRSPRASPGLSGLGALAAHRRVECAGAASKERSQPEPWPWLAPRSPHAWDAPRGVGAPAPATSARFPAILCKPPPHAQRPPAAPGRQTVTFLPFRARPLSLPRRRRSVAHGARSAPRPAPAVPPNSVPPRPLAL